MNPIVFAIVLVTAIGLICSVVLVIAAKVMAVKEDEKFAPLREALPGANCGACGYPGCDGYAKALAAGTETRTNLCVPGADSCAKAVADVLGVEAADVVEMVAVVHCSGDCEHTQEKMNYTGERSCKAMKLYFGGVGACSFGCMGGGDCAAVCPKGAINMVKGIAEVDRSLCIGCSLCVKACPSHIISVIPQTANLVVKCSSTAKGVAVRKACSAGCIGCTKCQQVCPHDAIHIVNNLAVVDQDKCTGCGTCAESCPTKCLTVVDVNVACGNA
ncbi:MAG: RnfABCDGE type electron transport complex subunit B [Oscillospiraceae bacterium]